MVILFWQFHQILRNHQKLEKQVIDLINPVPILKIYIWYSELFNIANKKCLMDLFVISRFDCTALIVTWWIVWWYQIRHKHYIVKQSMKKTKSLIVILQKLFFLKEAVRVNWHWALTYHRHVGHLKNMGILYALSIAHSNNKTNLAISLHPDP